MKFIATKILADIFSATCLPSGNERVIIIDENRLGLGLAHSQGLNVTTNVVDLRKV